MAEAAVQTDWESEYDEDEEDDDEYGSETGGDSGEDEGDSDGYDEETGSGEIGEKGETKLYDLDALDEWGNEILTVTVDSGAAESVMPVNMLPKVPLSDGPSNKKYRAAGGKLLEDKGAKKVMYWGKDGKARRMTFRMAEVNKPLASVRRICDSGNRVVFDSGSSYIEHKATGQRTKMRQENGTYVLDVPLADITEGFTGQGQ